MTPPPITPHAGDFAFNVIIAGLLAAALLLALTGVIAGVLDRRRRRTAAIGAAGAAAGRRFVREISRCVPPANRRR